MGGLRSRHEPSREGARLHGCQGTPWTVCRSGSLRAAAYGREWKSQASAVGKQVEAKWNSSAVSSRHVGQCAKTLTQPDMSINLRGKSGKSRKRRHEARAPVVIARVGRGRS